MLIKQMNCLSIEKDANKMSQKSDDKYHKGTEGTKGSESYDDKDGDVG